MTDNDNEDKEKDVAPEHEHLIGNSHAVGNNGGAPEGNKNAVGGAGGNPGPNNQNAAKNFTRSDPNKLIKWMEDKRPADYSWVMSKYQSYLDDSPFEDGTGKADKLLETCVCEWIIWENRGVQIRDGIVTKTHIKGSDGELVEVEDERPENAAINRIDRQVMSKLKKLGILDDDPDARMAGAMEQMSSDDYIIEVDSSVEDEDYSVEDGD